VHVRGFVEQNHGVLMPEGLTASHKLSVVLVHEGDGSPGADLQLKIPGQWRVVHPKDLRAADEGGAA
jgi:hypothetical protein